MIATRHSTWPALLLGGACAATAWAQTARSDADTPPQDPMQVLSDVRPLPAEDRDSTGVLMDASRMKAHEATSAGQRPDNAIHPVVGPDVSRLVEQTRWEDGRETAPGQVPRGEASGAPAEAPGIVPPVERP